MSDEIQVGQRVRVVSARNYAGAAGLEGVVVAVDDESGQPWEVEVPQRVWCTEVEPVEPVDPEWRVGDACEVLLDGEWRLGTITDKASDQRLEGRWRVSETLGEWSAWAPTSHMRRPEAAKSDPVAELRAEVARLSDRVTASEARRGEVTLTEQHIGRVVEVPEVTSLRARLAEVEAERDALQRGADVVAHALGLVDYREGQGKVYGSLDECAERAHRLVTTEARYADLRAVLREALGIDAEDE